MDKELVELDIANGLTLTMIAKKYKLSLSTAHRKLKNLGLKPTKRKHYLKGQRFGRLEVLDECTKNKHASWNCKCDCGNLITVRAGHLIDEGTKSCGCLSHDLRWTGFGEMSGDYWVRVNRGAKTRNLELTITAQDAWEKFLKQEKKCALSGIDLSFASNFKDKNQIHTASLDRIDSSKGYIEGNIQWVHKTVQLMKNNLQENKFLYFCKAITCHKNSS